MQLTAVPSMTALAALIRRDIKIALRVGGGALIGVLFFLTVVVLMPFAVGPDLKLLTRLGPAILWIGALLASLLTLDRLFMADHEDGSRDLIVMGRTPLELACAAKALAHWLAAGLPLIAATPVLGLLLNLDAASTSAVALTLLAGTPALTFTGMIGAALAVTLHRGGLLLAVVVLPLSIPVLIFGVAASEAAISGPVSFGAPFSILCALSLFSLVIGPFAAAASLRHGLDCSTLAEERSNRALPIACNGHDDYQDAHDADRPRQPDPVPDAHLTPVAVACGYDRASAPDRSLSIGHGARRLPAGRHRQDHVHSRAECVALDVRVGRDEPCGARHAGVAASLGGRCCQGRRPDRRGLHVSGAGDGVAVGAADVGHLLGMGCAADVCADFVSDVSRPDRAVARGRGPVARRARRCDLDAGRRHQPADHQILGGLVEYAASAGVGDADRRADARPRLFESVIGDGGGVFAAVRDPASRRHAQRNPAPPRARLADDASQPRHDVKEGMA